MARTGWENLADVFMGIGSQYRENKQREYDREAQLEMMRMQLLEQAKDAARRRDHELELQSKDAASAMKRLQTEIQAEKDLQVAEQKFRTGFEDIMQKNREALANIEGGYRLKEEQMGIKAGKYEHAPQVSLNLLDKEEMQKKQRHKDYLQSMIESEAARITEYIGKKKGEGYANSYNKFRDDIASKWGIDLGYDEYKQLQENELLREKYIRDVIARKVGEQYIGGLYYQTLGEGPVLLGDELKGFLGQWYGETEFEPGPAQQPLGQRLKEDLSRDPVGKYVVPTPLGPLPGPKTLEGIGGGLKRVFGPKIKDETEGYDYELTNPFGGTPSEAEAGPLPGESKEAWLERIRRKMKGMFNK